jgi:transcriptional regulator with XRE-family HTH domain
MENDEIINTLKKVKLEKGYTLHELSKKLDVQVTTIERWFKTKRINKVYAWFITEKMKSL